MNQIRQNNETQFKLIKMADYQTKYQEIKKSLEILMQQNNSLKLQLKEAQNELLEKQMLKDEWSEEIDQIKQTIGDLQQENEFLSNEVEILTRNNNEQQKLVQQQQEQLSLLKEQAEKAQAKADAFRLQTDQLQGRLFDVEVQTTQCKQQLQLKTTEYESHVNQVEISWQKKYRELEQRYQHETDSSRRSYQYEIEKLQSTVDQIEVENQKLQQQCVQGQEAIYSLKEQLLQKEMQLKQHRDEQARHSEQSITSHAEEIKKLQSIIDNQNALIQSYERVIEIEKSDENKTRANHSNIDCQQDEQVLELKNRVIILTNKLNDERCHYEREIQIMQEEAIKLQLIISDQKQVLQQYERILERDRRQFEKMGYGFPDQHQISELVQQNRYLQEKLSLQQQQQQQYSQQHQQLHTLQQQTQPQHSQIHQQNYYCKDSNLPLRRRDENQLNQTVPSKQDSSRPPKTFFAKKQTTKKRSFPTQESEDTVTAEREFEQEFLDKFQSVIGRMESKLTQMQTELNFTNRNKYK